MHFGRRDYDPSLGRWITADPRGYDDGPNLYAYVHNNPLTHFDPDGMLDIGNNSLQYQLEAEENARSLCFGTMQGFCHPIDTASKWWGYRAHLTQCVAYRDFSSISNWWKSKTSLEKKTWCYEKVGEATGFVAGVAAAIETVGTSCVAGAYLYNKGFQIAASVVAKSAASKVGTETAALNVLKGTEQASKGFLGRRGWQLENFFESKARNEASVILEREYTKHAIDQMQNRGILPSVVENTIQEGLRIPGKETGTVAFYDACNHITVIIEEKSGRVITTSFGCVKQ